MDESPPDDGLSVSAPRKVAPEGARVARVWSVDPRRWLAIAIVAEVVIALVDFFSSATTVLIGLVALPVLVTGILCTPRQSGVAGVVATVLVAISGSWDHNYGTGQFVIRLGFVAAISVLSVVIASVLAERDSARIGQATARRLAEQRFQQAEEARRDGQTTIDALQVGLMPARIPDAGEWDVAGRFRGGSERVDVGGDFYVVVPVGDGLAVIVGDVTGRGVAAAVVGTSVRHAARALAYVGHSPTEVVRAINDLLVAGPGFTPVTLVGLWLARSDGGSCRATLISAGHPLPFVVRGAGDATQVGAPGTLLGAFPSSDCDWPVTTVAVAPDDILFLFTDGVTEAGGRSDRFGEARLKMVLAGAPRRPEALIDRVDEAVSAFVDANDHSDDIAMVAVRLRP